MKKEKKYLNLLIIVCLFFQACGKNKKVFEEGLVASDTSIENSETYFQNYPTNLSRIPIDKSTSLFNFISQPARINDRDKLLIFSNIENALLIYDILSKQLENKIPFPREGPNSLTGIEVGSGMTFVNSDSIIFYSPLESRLKIANIQGEVIDKINLRNDTITYGVLGLSTPMAYRKQKVFLQTQPILVGRSESEIQKAKYLSRTISEIDLKTGKVIQHKINFPELYDDLYVSQQLENMNLLYSSEIDKFIISLPLHGKLIVTDFNGSYREVDAASSLVRSVYDLKNQPNVPKNQILSYGYWMSDSYAELVYDPKTEYYYRFARSKVPENDFLARNFLPEKEVVILDKGLEVVGRYPHNGSNVYYYFFDEEGIYWNMDMKKFNLNTNNEDTIFFNHVKVYN